MNESFTTLEETAKIENKAAEELEYSSYSFSVGDNLYRRLSNHIDKLKHVESRGFSKQKWLEQAIKEKLTQENSFEADQSVTREKYLFLKLNKYLKNEIERRVEKLRKIRGIYSKKKWLEEAIQYKLDRDEQKIKKAFSDDFF